jgi:hypothetical protein
MIRVYYVHLCCGHFAVVGVVQCRVGVESPYGEGHRNTTCSSERKRENKHEYLRATIDGGTQEVVVFLEPSRAVFTDVEVGGETNCHPSVDVAIGTASKIGHVVWSTVSDFAHYTEGGDLQARTGVLTFFSHSHLNFL